MTTTETLSPFDAPAIEKNRAGNGGKPNANSHTFTASEWSVEDSARLYNIRGWGQQYFSINNDGNVSVHPTGETAKSIDLKKLVEDLRSRDINAPVLIRFTD